MRGKTPGRMSRMNSTRQRRTFTDEYKAEVVGLFRTTDKGVTELAKGAGP